MFRFTWLFKSFSVYLLCYFFCLFQDYSFVAFNAFLQLWYCHGVCFVGLNYCSHYMVKLHQHRSRIFWPMLLFGMFSPCTHLIDKICYTWETLVYGFRSRHFILFIFFVCEDCNLNLWAFSIFSYDSFKMSHISLIILAFPILI